MTTGEIVRVLFVLPWILFLLYWIVKGIKTRPTREAESFASRYSVMLLVVVGYLLIFSRFANIGVLGTGFMSRTRTSVMAGVVLTWLGLGLAVWARYHLAEYWSLRVTIKEDHQLIRTGPYARLRHPIYSGIVLAAIGSALVIDKWRCVLGVGIVLTGFCLKARKEETMLTQQFGDAFREHQKHAGFLIPRFR